MPAKSKAQQAFFGAVRGYKKNGGKASPAVKKAAGGMTDKAAKDFASTKTKGLPKHVKKESFERKLEEALGYDNPHMKDLGFANRWHGSTPSEYELCRASKHPLTVRKKGKYRNQYMCPNCSITWDVDSSG